MKSATSYFNRFLDIVERVGNFLPHPASLFAIFALAVAFVAKYDPKAGMGSVIALMLPYTIVFTIVWSILLTIFILLELPVGPGAGLYLPQ